MGFMATVIVNGTPGVNGVTGPSPTSGQKGGNAVYTLNGTIGADSTTVTATGGTGGLGGDHTGGGAGAKGGNGGDATITLNGNIFKPIGMSLDVITTATGGNGGLGGMGVPSGSQGNGGNATATFNGNIIQTKNTLSQINVRVAAQAGMGTKDGNATATANGNIIQYNGSTATNVLLKATATDALEPPGFTGSAYGTKTATLNGNIIQGNVNDVTLAADTIFNNSTATINGNIITAKPANTGFVTMEATGQTININGNIVNLGKQELDISLTELGPTYKASVSGNIFNGTGNNTFSLSDFGSPTTPDTASINLAAGTFTFNGQSNIINKFGGIALSGNIAGNFIGTSGNNVLDASGDATTGTIIFQGNGGTDTLKAGTNALNVADFAGSDWQYNAPAMHPVVGPVTVSTIPANIVAPNAVIPTASDMLMGTFQRLKFLSPANVSDVNDDGFGDLILQDGAGNLQANLIGPAFSVGPAISPIPQPGAGWTAVGTGQFTADSNRNSGVLTQDVTGELGIETSIAGAPAFTGPILGGTANVMANTFTGWNAITAGDFNGDGASDVLLQNGPGGPVEIAFMNTKAGEAVGQIDKISAVTAPTATITTGAWNVVSSGDFNGDGNSDILWQSATNGSIDISLMNGATGTPVSIGVAPAGYTAVGTGDFNGDGKSDVLFENTTSGDAQIWLMNGTTPGSIINVTGPGTTATGWKLLGAEDINQDGFSDLLWQNSVSGDIKAQAMTTGGAPLGLLHDLGTVAPLSFKLVASTGGG
jgi:hypothetical protein